MYFIELYDRWSNQIGIEVLYQFYAILNDIYSQFLYFRTSKTQGPLTEIEAGSPFRRLLQKHLKYI